VVVRRGCWSSFPATGPVCIETVFRAEEDGSTKSFVDGLALAAEITDPDWPITFGYGGFVNTDAAATEVFRVWGGVVQVGTKFYNDPGLENYLINLAVDR